MAKTIFQFRPKTTVFDVTALQDLPFIKANHSYLTLKVEDSLKTEYILVIRVTTDKKMKVVFFPPNRVIQNLFKFTSEAGFNASQMGNFIEMFNKVAIPASPFVNYELKMTA